MNKVLDFVIMYGVYLVVGFIGIWLGSLVMGTDTNPFTSWIPYILALAFTLLDFKFNKGGF